jgi:hypothetical protein
MLVGRSRLIPLEHAVSLHRKVDQPGQPDAVMRIVVRNGFSRDLADVFLADLRRHCRALAAHPQAHTPLAPEPFRQGFAH